MESASHPPISHVLLTPFHGKPINIIPFAGLLSFGSIFIELYYVLTSLWNYKVYHVYGFLLAVYIILAMVVSMTTIIVVYFCLNAENYLWQWTALASGGSTAGYVFLYGIYYFIQDSNDGVFPDYVLFWLYVFDFVDFGDIKWYDWAFCSKSICKNYLWECVLEMLI